MYIFSQQFAIFNNKCQYNYIIKFSYIQTFLLRCPLSRLLSSDDYREIGRLVNLLYERFSLLAGPSTHAFFVIKLFSHQGVGETTKNSTMEWISTSVIFVAGRSPESRASRHTDSRIMDQPTFAPSAIRDSVQPRPSTIIVFECTLPPFRESVLPGAWTPESSGIPHISSTLGTISCWVY